MTHGELLAVMTTQYVLKSSWEVLSTPLTYKLVNFLKRAEHEDYYDREHEFHAVLPARAGWTSHRRLSARLRHSAQGLTSAVGDALNPQFLAAEEPAVRRFAIWPDCRRRSARRCRRGRLQLVLGRARRASAAAADWMPCCSNITWPPRRAWC